MTENYLLASILSVLWLICANICFANNNTGGGWVYSTVAAAWMIASFFL